MNTPRPTDTLAAHVSFRLTEDECRTMVLRADRERRTVSQLVRVPLKNVAARCVGDRAATCSSMWASMFGDSTAARHEASRVVHHACSCSSRADQLARTVIARSLCNPTLLLKKTRSQRSLKPADIARPKHDTHWQFSPAMVDAEPHRQQMSFSFDLGNIRLLEDDVGRRDAGDGHETLEGRYADERN